MVIKGACTWRLNYLFSHPIRSCKFFQLHDPNHGSKPCWSSTSAQWFNFHEQLWKESITSIQDSNFFLSIRILGYGWMRNQYKKNIWSKQAKERSKIKGKVNPNKKAKLTASLTKTEEAAPFHLGSESGKIWPMSGRPNAPKIASTTQWSNTSPTQHHKQKQGGNQT